MLLNYDQIGAKGSDTISDQTKWQQPTSQKSRSSLKGNALEGKGATTTKNHKNMHMIMPIVRQLEWLSLCCSHYYMKVQNSTRTSMQKSLNVCFYSGNACCTTGIFLCINYEIHTYERITKKRHIFHKIRSA